MGKESDYKSSKLLILGAGGYGHIIKDLAKNLFFKVDFLDDNSNVAIGILDDSIKLTKEYKYAIPSFGNPDLRKKWLTILKEQKYEVPIIISDMAYVADSSVIGAGSVVEPMAVINSNCKIGESVFVCANSTINHNSTVGDFVQVDCGAIVGSMVTIENNTHISYGQIIKK